MTNTLPEPTTDITIVRPT